MKKKNLLLIIVVMLLLFTSGCDLFKQNKEHLLIPDFKIKEDIDKSLLVIKENTVIIEEKSDNISITAQEVYDKAVGIQSKITDENKEKINPDLETIKENSKIIIKDSQEILKANMSIKEIKSILISVKNKTKTTNEILEKLVKERDDLSEKLRLAEESAKLQTQKTLQRIIFISIAGFGISVALIFLGSTKIGICGILGSLATLVLSIVVNQHIVLISYIGLIAIILIVLYLIYEGYIQKKIKRQLVETTELAKSGLSVEKKKEIFGEKSEVKRIQDKSYASKRVKEELKKLKEELKNQELSK